MAKIKELQAELKQTKEELAQAKEAIATKEALLDTLQTENSYMKDELEPLRETNQELRMKLNREKKYSEDVKQKVKKTEAELNRYKEYKSSAIKQIARLQMIKPFLIDSQQRLNKVILSERLSQRIGSVAFFCAWLFVVFSTKDFVLFLSIGAAFVTVLDFAFSFYKYKTDLNFSKRRFDEDQE